MKYKIVYMGTPYYAKEILNTLIEADDMEVSLVLTQPDRPVGRKKVLTPPPVKTLALEHGIDVLQPNRLSDEGIEDAIKKVNPDFIVVAAFGQILLVSTSMLHFCLSIEVPLLFNNLYSTVMKKRV
jgi:methionyl-tRNA formyltransferase